MSEKNEFEDFIHQEVKEDIGWQGRTCEEDKADDE